MAQVIAQSRPGVSPAREARRRPAAAIDAYRSATALTRRATTGALVDLDGV